MTLFQRCFSELPPKAFSKYTYWVSYPRYRAKRSYLSVKNSRAEAWASVQFSPSVMSNSLWPHGLQHARLPCPSPTLRACSNSCLLSRWCHPTISSSVIPFSSCLQSIPASGSFLMSQLFESGGQSIGVSASTSVLPMNTQDWSHLFKNFPQFVVIHTKALA